MEHLTWHKGVLWRHNTTRIDAEEHRSGQAGGTYELMMLGHDVRVLQKAYLEELRHLTR